MTRLPWSITTNVKHRVRTTGSEHQDQNSISDPDQNFGFTCIFSSGVQEKNFLPLSKFAVNKNVINKKFELSK